MFLTAIIVAIALFGSQEEILAISLCCIPLHEAIDFYVVLVACALLLIVKANRTIKFGPSMFVCFFVIAWELLHTLIIEVSLMSLLISIIPLFFLVIILNLDVLKIDYAFVVRALAYISAIFSVIVLLNSVVRADFDFVKAVLNLQRLGDVSEDEALLGGRINPNALGIINILSVTSLLQLHSMNKQRKIDYVLGVVLIVFGFLTASKTFLLCLLLMLFLLILGQKGDMHKKIRFILILIGSAIVAFLILNLLFYSVVEYYITRFQVEDITTGRINLVILYNEYIDNHPWILFFGIGAADMSNKIINVYDIAKNVPHNSIQEIIVAWGIPGLLVMAFLIGDMIKESKRFSNKKVLLNFIPLIILLFKSMAGQFITSKYTMLALVLAYLSLCQDFTMSEQQN